MRSAFSTDSLIIFDLENKTKNPQWTKKIERETEIGKMAKWYVYYYFQELLKVATSRNSTKSNWKLELWCEVNVECFAFDSNQDAGAQIRFATCFFNLIVIYLFTYDNSHWLRRKTRVPSISLIRSSWGGFFSPIYDLRIKINFRNPSRASMTRKKQLQPFALLDLVPFEIFQLGKKISISNECLFLSFLYHRNEMKWCKQREAATGNRSSNSNGERERDGGKKIDGKSTWTRVVRGWWRIFQDGDEQI